MTSNERVALLIILACLLCTIVFLILYRLRISPAEQERRRRIKLNLLGRMGDAVLTDVQDDVLYYSYTVSGVSYHASQDVSMLRRMLPPDVSSLIGPVTMKYLARNPANSIVVCEHWSGLRIREKFLNGSTAPAVGAEPETYKGEEQ